MTTVDPAVVDDEQPPDVGGSGLKSLRMVSRTLGELLVTAGVIVLLFVAYQLVWTNVQADRAAATNTDDLFEKWRATPAAPEFDLPLNDGEPFAVLHIPRLGERYQVPVVEGVTLDDLAEGVGHYPGSALPGEVGNFSVAGHRATNGEPFAELDLMQDGDAVVVETASTYYTYEVYRERIVPPTQVGVILPVPDRPKVEPRRDLLTLTTCNPRWASYERLIIHAVLSDEQAKSLGPPDAMGGG